MKYDNPPCVVKKDSANPDETHIYEIEALIGKRVSGKRIEYLVKWKGYGNEHNV